MNAYQSPEKLRASTLSRDEVADLLDRYPRVSDTEAKAILTFLRRGRHLDVGMLTADDRVKPQLDEFMADHGKHLRLGAGETAAVVGAIGGFLALCWLLWEWVRPGVL